MNCSAWGKKLLLISGKVARSRREGNTLIWFWIGDHDEYDHILR